MVENLCPRLSHLHLIQTNLLHVAIGDLPSSLESLAITSSRLQTNWFQPLSVSNEAILPHLKELDLSGTTLLSSDDIDDVPLLWSRLVSLKLNHCSFVTDERLQLIAARLHRLDVLEFAGTRCTNVAFDHICRNLSASLRRLSVAGCQSLTDRCIGMIFTKLTNLRSLDVSKCPQMGCFFVSVAQLSRTLRYLNVSDTLISVYKLERLKSSLPACKIVYETSN